MKEAMENIGIEDLVNEKETVAEEKSLSAFDSRGRVNLFHIHALFVELFAWAMLSVFVDLPLRMKFLRPVIRGRHSEAKREKEIQSNKLYFIVTSLVSFLEVFCMAEKVFVLSRKHNVECQSVSSQRQTAILMHQQQCDLGGTNYSFANHTFTECNILNMPSSTLPAEVYEIINDENARKYAIILIAILLFLRALSAWILYESIWGSRCAHMRGSVRYQTPNRRQSEAMFRGQQYGRATSKDRTKTSNSSMRFNRMATTIAINRKKRAATTASSTMPQEGQTR